MMMKAPISIRAMLFCSAAAWAAGANAQATLMPGNVAATSSANEQSTGTVSAQTSAPPAVSGTDDIIVTAQRRDERLSRTPVAVSVLSSNTLAKAQVVTESDLRLQVPGLQIRAGQSSNQLNYAIRGQSLDPYSYSRPGVLPYFNEVQVGGEGTSSAFYDLQSVQVLKGPQGTLFGRNATGGAVLFTSTQPQQDFGGYVSASGGNYGYVKGEGAINVPLIDDVLLARVAGVYADRHGIQQDLFYGRKLGGTERYGVRGSITLKPGAAWSDTLVVDYYHANGTNTIGVLSSLNPSGGFPATSLYTNAVFPAGSGPLTGTSLSDFVLGQILVGQGLPASVAAQLSAGNYARLVARINNPAVPAGGLATILAQQNARGPYVVASNGANNYNAENVVVSNVTTLELSDTAKLKNVIGYTNLRNFTNNDVDGTGFGIGDNGSNPNLGVRNRTRQFSEELQLLGSAASDRFTYVLGGFYSDEKSTTYQSSSFFDVVLGGQTQINDNGRLNTTLAAYGQGTYKLNDSGLSATAGLRYTNEKVRSVIYPGDSLYQLGVTQPKIYNNDQSRRFNTVGYTVGLQQQVDQSLFLYAASRRSYKNGGFNSFIAPKIGFAETGGSQYRSETLTDVEGGAKFNGRVSGVPFRANAAIFYDWIDNSQRAAFVLIGGAPQTATVNVPAKIYGGELDAVISPTGWLSLGGSVNYTHARFDRNQTAVAGTFSSFETYPDTPEWSGSVFADIALPVSDRLTGTLHGDMFGQTRTFFSSTANLNAGAFNPGYALANFRVGVEDEGSGWSLTANVKNAFAKVYYVGGLALGQLIQINTRIPGEPRTFTIEARLKF